MLSVYVLLGIHALLFMNFLE